MAVDPRLAPGAETIPVHGQELALEQLSFENPYAALPEEFWHAVVPQPLLDASLLSFSDSAAALIGLAPTQRQRENFIDYFTGQRRLDGMQPLAMC